MGHYMAGRGIVSLVYRLWEQGLQVEQGQLVRRFGHGRELVAKGTEDMVSMARFIDLIHSSRSPTSSLQQPRARYE